MDGKYLRLATLAICGSAFIAVMAQIQVPLKPVPITMQTFAVLVIGAAYGWRLGTGTVALYLAEGAVGLPVFAGFKGSLAVLLGPTGGYLFGFVLAAGTIGWLAARGWDRLPHMVVLAMVLGNIAIYVPGLFWLAKFVPEGQVLAMGMTPFLIGDGLKLLLAAAALPLAWKCVRRIQP
jgi:biotin transport system substrate-specific component